MHHTKEDTLTQVCDEYLIELNLIDGKISFSSLELIEEGEIDSRLFEVSIENYQNRHISSFLPVKSPSGTYMLLAISYGKVKNTQWVDEKF